MIVCHILIYVSKKAKHGAIVAGFAKLDSYSRVSILSLIPLKEKVSVIKKLNIL